LPTGTGGAGILLACMGQACNKEQAPRPACYAHTAATSCTPPSVLCCSLASYAGGVVISNKIVLHCALIQLIPSVLPLPSTRSLASFAGGVVIPKESVLTVPCDVLIPAAIGGVIDEDNARDLQCKVRLSLYKENVG